MTPFILSERKSCTRICLKVISPATPAAWALAFAISTMRASISQPMISSSTSRLIFLAASVRTSWINRSLTQFHSSKAKERRRPGAIFLAIIAASIQKVPEPQVGSIKGLSGYQLESCKMAAAMFSLIGAPPFSVR